MTMTDVSCLLAGLTRLLDPPLLLLIWHKKTGARLYPAMIAFSVCLPVFLIGNIIRSGFSRDDPVTYYIWQGLLFGILEEGAKYLMLRFVLPSYDSTKDAVSYGIGHGAWEDLGAGFACLGLIGTGRADPNIFWFSLFLFLEGAAFCIAVTVLIFWGIRTGRSRIMLPAAILLHAVSSAAAGLLSESAAITIRFLLTAGICYAAYRCARALRDPYADTFDFQDGM